MTIRAKCTGDKSDVDRLRILTQVATAKQSTFASSVSYYHQRQKAIVSERSTIWQQLTEYSKTVQHGYWSSFSRCGFKTHVDISNERDKLQRVNSKCRRIYLTTPTFVVNSSNCNNIKEHVLSGRYHGIFLCKNGQCSLWRVFAVDEELPCKGYSFAMCHGTFQNLKRYLAEREISCLSLDAFGKILGGVDRSDKRNKAIDLVVQKQCTAMQYFKYQTVAGAASSKFKFTWNVFVDRNGEHSTEGIHNALKRYFAANPYKPRK